MRFDDVTDSMKLGQMIRSDSNIKGNRSIVALKDGITNPEEFARSILCYVARVYTILKNEREMTIDEEIQFVNQIIDAHKKLNKIEWAAIKSDISWFCNITLTKTGKKSTKKEISKIATMLVYLVSPPEENITEEELGLRFDAVENWMWAGFEVEEPIYKIKNE